MFKKTHGPRQEAEIDRSLIGKNASVILQKAGIRCDDSIRLGICEVDHDHPLLWTEQMMPIFPVTRVRDADEGIDFAIAVGASAPAHVRDAFGQPFKPQPHGARMQRQHLRQERPIAWRDSASRAKAPRRSPSPARRAKA